MNNLDEKYPTYNQKDKSRIGSNARVPYNPKNNCWMAPGGIKITERQAEKLLIKLVEIMK